jgi:hypothetical protein
MSQPFLKNIELNQVLGVHKITVDANRFIAASQLVLTALVKRMSNEDIKHGEEWQYR